MLLDLCYLFNFRLWRRKTDTDLYLDKAMSFLLKKGGWWEIRVASDRRKSWDYCLLVSLNYEYFPFPLLYTDFFFAVQKLAAEP